MGGGGIFIGDIETAIINGNIISDNSAGTGSGRGIYAGQGGIIDGNTISNNFSTHHGGGIMISSGQIPT